MSTVDGIVIGGGHNGLICAAYMARAGLHVAVIERNPEIGGGCTTEEVTLPGFRHNLHSNFYVGCADAPLFRDLELDRHGFSLILPPVQRGITFRDHTCLVVHRDPEKTAASIARFSESDAETYRKLYGRYAVRMRPLLLSLVYSPPLPSDELKARIRGHEGEELLAYASLTMNEAIEKTFENDKVRSFIKMVIHSATVENVPGTGVFFPMAISGLAMAALPVGGSVQLPRALARSIEADGGEVLRGRTVTKIEVSSGEARAVVLEDGERWEARKFIAGGIDAPQTLRLLGEKALPETVVRKLQGWNWGAHTLCTLHLALNEPPRYLSSSFDPDIDRTYDVHFGAESGEEITENFNEVHRGKFPLRPMGNGACNSLFDPTYAPHGKHTAFWWVWARHALKAGGAAAWDTMREEAARRLLEAWRGYAPNLTDDNVLKTYVYTPLDISRRNLNMVQGSQRGGGYTADQIGVNRPHPLLSGFRTPVRGLFLCSSSCHGGGLNGGPGYIAANVIAEDLGVRPFWEKIPSPEWKG